MEEKIKHAIEALEKNRINAYFCKNKKEAMEKTLDLVPENSTIGYGGSMTVESVGVRQKLLELEKLGKVKIFNQYDDTLSREKKLKLRHKGMQADVFITGTNAITQSGELVNVDGYGNRIAAQVCGPECVIIISGKNKIVKNYEEAIERIETIAAPLNAKRLNKKTPCVRTGKCMDCDSPDRICNYTTIIHKSRDKDRMHVVIVDEDLGL